MISHDYKCILIHIPRTGGSSFEHAIIGDNWWSIDRSTKHILASQAKRAYGEYWDEYFKFSVVRNPWDRCISMLNFGGVYYGQASENLTMRQLEWYKAKFGYPRIVEYDYRFYDREGVIRPEHTEKQVYGNILDEELDYVARFEQLEDDFAEISKILGLSVKRLPKKAASKDRRPYRDSYEKPLREAVRDLYRRDIEAYGYSF